MKKMRTVVFLVMVFLGVSVQPSFADNTASEFFSEIYRTILYITNPNNFSNLGNDLNKGFQNNLERMDLQNSDIPVIKQINILSTYDETIEGFEQRIEKLESDIELLGDQKDRLQQDLTREQITRESEKQNYEHLLNVEQQKRSQEKQSYENRILTEQQRLAQERAEYQQQIQYEQDKRNQERQSYESQLLAEQQRLAQERSEHQQQIEYEQQKAKQQQLEYEEKLAKTIRDSLEALAAQIPTTRIEDQTIHWDFYDSKKNRYSWSMPVDTYENLVQIDPNYEYLHLELNGETRRVIDHTKFVRGDSFSKVIDDVYNNSESDEDFILEVWYIVSQLTTYSYDIGEDPRYALETLSRGGGDCEDTSILIADMIRSSAHTKHWDIQFLYFDSDNPADPQNVNHVIVTIDTGSAHYRIESTAKTVDAMNYWAGKTMAGWRFQV